MRIYYFGKLIEDTDSLINKNVKTEEPESAGMQSIGEILEEIDMYHDVYRSKFSGQANIRGGLHHA